MMTGQTLVPAFVIQGSNKVKHLYAGIHCHTVGGGSGDRGVLWTGATLTGSSVVVLVPGGLLRQMLRGLQSL